jgi:hypothetical protein
MEDYFFVIEIGVPGRGAVSLFFPAPLGSGGGKGNST